MATGIAPGIQGVILQALLSLGNNVVCNEDVGGNHKFTVKAFIVQQDNVLQKQINMETEYTDKDVTVFIFDGQHVDKIVPGMQITSPWGAKFRVGPEVHPEYLQDTCLYISAPAYKW